MARLNEDHARDLADQLRNHIAGHTELLHLPAIPELARRWRIDIRVVAAAVHQLRQEGILDFRRGQRMRIAGRGSPMDRSVLRDPAQTAAARLYSRLRERIEIGSYRHGEPLPKRTFLAAESGVSPQTVSNATGRLADAGLVHRRGRSFVVGRPSSASGVVVPRGRLTVLVVQSNSRGWLDMKTERTGRFATAFNDQAQRHNVRLVPCVVDASRGVPPLAPRGEREILALIRDTGTLYCGCLVVGKREHFADFDGLLGRLVSFGRPVVWPDTKEDEPRIAFAHEHFSRCRFSEEAVAACAVEFLLSMGHTRIGYSSYTPSGWQERRRRLLIAAARQTGVEITLPRLDQASTTPREQSEDSLTAAIAGHRERGSARVTKVISLLERETTANARGRATADPCRRIAAFLRSPDRDPKYPDRLNALRGTISFVLCYDVTAIVSPRDYAARQHQDELAQLGLDIPGDISLISFDNYLDEISLPVTTVDFGTEWLGYAAFHAIVGGVPVPRGSDGSIVAKPRIMRRGTVGRVVGNAG